MTALPFFDRIVRKHKLCRAMAAVCLGWFAGCDSSEMLQYAVDQLPPEQQAAAVAQLPADMASRIQTTPPETALLISADVEPAFEPTQVDRPADFAEVSLPSPDRVNPFLKAAASTVDSTDLNDRRNVRVLGFVDGPTPRVMLSVNGKIRSYAAGESDGGLKVVSLEMPTVKLMINKVEWELSLFDR